MRRLHAISCYHHTYVCNLLLMLMARLLYQDVSVGSFGRRRKATVVHCQDHPQ